MQDSSVIKDFQYDRLKTDSDSNTSSILTITFQSDRTYYYYNVPEEVFKTFSQAESKGQEFNRLIKDQYPFDIEN